MHEVAEIAFLSGINATITTNYSLENLRKLGRDFPSWEEVTSGFQGISEANNILHRWDNGEMTSFVEDYNNIMKLLTMDASNAHKTIDTNTQVQ